jgi:hypothetical protein
MLKKFVRGSSALLLKLCLFNLALVGAFVMTFGTSTQIKQTLAESKLYDSFIDTVLESVKQAPEQQEGFPINAPEVQAAAKNAFPPNQLQSYTEQFIDSLYRWLEGNAAQPDFRIDLTDARQKFAEGIGNYALSRYNSLPACTVAQLRQLDPEVDPFTVPCQVPGFDPSSARQEVINEIVNSKEVLGDPVISTATLPKDEQGRNVFENIAFLQDLSKLMNLLPWILGALSLIFAAALVALYDERRRGFRAVGVILAGTGAFLLVSTLLLSYAFAQVNKPGGKLAQSVQGSFQDTVLSISRSINMAVNKYLIIFSAAYVIAGGMVLLYLHFTDKKLSPEEQQALLDSMALDKDKPTKPAVEKAAEPKTDKPEDNKE